MIADSVELHWPLPLIEQAEVLVARYFKLMEADDPEVVREVKPNSVGLLELLEDLHAELPLALRGVGWPRSAAPPRGLDPEAYATRLASIRDSLDQLERNRDA